MKYILGFILIVMNIHAKAEIKFVQPNMKNIEEPLIYIGLNHLFKIENTEKFKILNITATEGKIERLNDSTFLYSTKTSSINGIQFAYSYVKSGKLQKSIKYPTLYRTATVPDITHIRLGTKTNGKINLIELNNIVKLSLDDRDFKLKLNYKIDCDINCKPIKTDAKYYFKIKNSDLQNNIDYQEMITKLSKGDRIRFDNIKIIGSDNKVKKTLESVIFTVE